MQFFIHMHKQVKIKNYLNISRVVHNNLSKLRIINMERVTKIHTHFHQIDSTNLYLCL